MEAYEAGKIAKQNNLTKENYSNLQNQGIASRLDDVQKRADEHLSRYGTTRLSRGLEWEQLPTVIGFLGVAMRTFGGNISTGTYVYSLREERH